MTKLSVRFAQKFTHSLHSPIITPCLYHVYSKTQTRKITQAHPPRQPLLPLPAHLFSIKVAGGIYDPSKRSSRFFQCAWKFYLQPLIPYDYPISLLISWQERNILDVHIQKQKTWNITQVLPTHQSLPLPLQPTFWSKVAVRFAKSSSHMDDQWTFLNEPCNIRP